MRSVSHVQLTVVQVRGLKARAAWRPLAGRRLNLLSGLGAPRRLVWMGILLPMVAGCGSSAGSFGISCTVHRLGPRVLQARATVTNGTSRTTNVIIYGPALLSLHHFAPVTLRPTQVVVTTGHAKTSYFGLIVPNVSPDHPAHLRLQFGPPPHPESIWADDKRRLAAAGASSSSTCVIRRRG